jgi:hypothetical protein
MEKIVVFKGNEVEINNSITTIAKSVGTTFNLKPLERIVDDFDDAIKELEKIAARHQVRGAESEFAATEMANQARKLSNAIDEARKEVKNPYDKFGKKIDGKVRPLSKRLEAIRTALGGKIIAHRQAVRLAQEEAARAAAEEARKAADTGKIAIVVAPKPVDTYAKVDTEVGSVKSDFVPVFEVEDWSKVDQKYLTLNTKALEADLKLGVSVFSGIKVGRREVARFRAR